MKTWPWITAVISQHLTVVISTFTNLFPHPDNDVVEIVLVQH